MIERTSLPPRRIREIEENDISNILPLLCRGFPTRSKRYWEKGFARLKDRPTLANIPRFGYLAESGGDYVGVLLVISHSNTIRDHAQIFCNLSSWYIEPDFRMLSLPLLLKAIKKPDVTYTDISPIPAIVPFLKKLSFKHYTQGQYLAAPILSRRESDVKLRSVNIDTLGAGDMEPEEKSLLDTHVGFGCKVFCCSTPNSLHPFLFLLRRIKHVIPAAQLIYCRNTDEVRAFARPIGEFLLRHGYVFLLSDCDGPLTGLKGKYFLGHSMRYYKGDHPPAVGNLCYTELPIFGP